MDFNLMELYIIKEDIYNKGILVQIELGRTDLDDGDRVCLKNEIKIIDSINTKLIEMISNKRKV